MSETEADSRIPLPLSGLFSEHDVLSPQIQPFSPEALSQVTFQTLYTESDAGLYA